MSGKPRILRFASFEMDLEEETLRKQGLLVHLAAQPFSILSLLASRPGEVIERSEIREALWGTETHVDYDQGINACIRQIRLALGDSANSPRFIETLARRGYRLLVPVEAMPAAPESPEPIPDATASPETPPTSSGSAWRPAWVITSLTALAMIIVLIATFAARRSPGPTHDQPLRERPILAVLPFENLSPNPGDEYLSNGLTEELIALLSRHYGGQLGVIARTSAMQFKESGADVGEIGEVLGADFLVEGSVRREGDRVRVTAQLISAKNHLHLWAGNYDRDLSGALALQGEVSRRIAGALALNLLDPSEVSAAATDGEAYQAYLQGKHLLHQQDLEGAEAALRKSVEIDPGFAPAYVELARLHLGELTDRRAYQAVRREIVKALSLDDSLPEAHRLAALGSFYYEWDFEGAFRELQRALSLSPTSSAVHHDIAAFYAIRGRHEEAMDSILESLRLDPLSQRINSDVGWYYYFARRYEESIEATLVTLDLAPVHWSLVCLQLASLETGDLQRIKESAALALDTYQAPAETQRALETAPAEDAARVFWTWYLSHLETNPSGRHISPTEVAMAHMALGDHGKTLEALESAVDERDGWELPFLTVYPLYDPLHSDPRFQSLVDRIQGPRSSTGAH